MFWISGLFSALTLFIYFFSKILYVCVIQISRNDQCLKYSFKSSSSPASPINSDIQTEIKKPLNLYIYGCCTVDSDATKALSLAHGINVFHMLFIWPKIVNLCAFVGY